MMNLFDDAPAFDRDGLAAKLRDLAAGGIFVGGSSWKYEGWLGQIYTRERYLARGKFSKARFEQTCLSEYATVFPTVCGDFAFYQFPTEAFWSKLFAQVPAGFQFAFKAPEEVTCRVFPSTTRYGLQGGRQNPGFLDAELFAHMFLEALEPYSDRTALLIFEFGTFHPRVLSGVTEFAERLDCFLEQLPRNWRYAVEVRNADFLAPEYFECLRRHNVAHVYNAWTRMPELPQQITLPAARTADFQVCRALLRQGRPYEQAVEMFSPYTEVRDVNPSAREGLRELLHIAREERKTTFIYVNNRLEGNSPGTIVSILD